MYKVASIAGGAAVCLTTASVGGYYMFAALDGDGQEQEGPNSITAVVQESLMFETLDSFKTTANSNTEGIKDFFVGLSKIEEGGQEMSENSTDFTTFLKGLDTSDKDAKSYARIEHQKKTTEDGSKWWGKFIWLWTFVSKDKGLITFNVLETTNDKKLSFKGVFYLLKKEESANWKVTHKKEPKDKSIDKGDGTAKPFSLYFPNPASATTNKNVPENWGFIEKGKESEAFEKMCEGTSCGTLKGGSTLSWTLDWKQETSGDKKPFGWTVETRWGSHFYGNDFVWASEFPNTFTGTWTLRNEDKTVTLPKP